MKDGILVTAIGSFSGNAIIDSLKRLKEYNVFGCDIYPAIWLPRSSEYLKVFKVPQVKKTEEYLSAVLSICESNKIRFIIPTTDIEIDVYNIFRETFKKRSITLCISGNQTISIARNKLKISTFFKDSAFKTIPTYKSINEMTGNLTFPYVAKLFNGRSSEGLMYIDNIEELKLVFKKTDYIIQPFIPGDIYTVDYIRSSVFGTDYSFPRLELLRTSNGAGITVQLVHDQFLSESASMIGTKLDVNGSINFEFVKFKDEYFLMDINPRFSAGIAFTAKAGYDLVKSHLNCFTGKDIENPVDYPDMIIAKTYIETIMFVNKK